MLSWSQDRRSDDVCIATTAAAIAAFAIIMILSQAGPWNTWPIANELEHVAYFRSNAPIGDSTAFSQMCLCDAAAFFSN